MASAKRNLPLILKTITKTVRDKVSQTTFYQTTLQWNNPPIIIIIQANLICIFSTIQCYNNNTNQTNPLDFLHPMDFSSSLKNFKHHSINFKLQLFLVRVHRLIIMIFIQMIINNNSSKKYLKSIDCPKK